MCSTLTLRSQSLALGLNGVHGDGEFCKQILTIYPNLAVSITSTSLSLRFKKIHRRRGLYKSPAPSVKMLRKIQTTFSHDQKMAFYEHEQSAICYNVS